MHYYKNFTYYNEENGNTYEIEVIGDSSDEIYYAKLFNDQQELLDETSFSRQPDEEDILIALGLCD
jgi:hypothetical protein